MQGSATTRNFNVKNINIDFSLKKPLSLEKC